MKQNEVKMQSKSDSTKRTAMISVRMSDSEKYKHKRSADYLGITITEYINLKLNSEKSDNLLFNTYDQVCKIRMLLSDNIDKNNQEIESNYEKINLSKEELETFQELIITLEYSLNTLTSHIKNAI